MLRTHVSQPLVHPTPWTRIVGYPAPASQYRVFP